MNRLVINYEYTTIKNAEANFAAERDILPLILPHVLLVPVCTLYRDSRVWSPPSTTPSGM